MDNLAKIFFILFFLSFLAVERGDCQITSTFRLKTIAAKGIIKLDSMSILPNSLFINGYDSSFFTINYLQSTIIWKKNSQKDSVLAVYRIIPFVLNKTAYRYNYDSVKNRFLAGNKIIINKGPATLDEYFGGKKINYSGSFGRNMSFGNTQDATFNSEFNLQINGLIGDSIQLLAAITDNNIPIQPDGNTKQLNEFDKILIQFKKNNWELNLGDVDIKEKQLYFMNFYKRSQGILFKDQNIETFGGKHSLTLGAGIAKGKFNRNVFQGLEGNQGPYKLQGANNELFFVVLSNTEKVYIDGELMQRGIDQDYTINYNTAEVTFTSKRLITQDKRIQVEFEYADNTYLNYLVYGEDVIEYSKKVKMTVAAFSNNDVASSPINQTLDNTQHHFLAGLGDSIQNAFYPSATLDTFSIGQIMYKKIDTIYNGQHDSIYVYSTSPDSANYNLNFVLTGNNKGNYIPYYNAANGKVYQWIEPINGVPQGNYQPAVFLITPKSHQVVSIRTDYAIDKKTSIKTEIAGSHYDINTLSSLDKQNDYGYAGKVSFLHTYRLSETKHTYNFNLNADYEFVNLNFQPLEVIRSVEFGRDWGLNLINNPATEQLPSVGLQVKDEKNNTAEYAFKAYLRSDGYKGTMQQFKILKAIYSWKVQSFIQYTANNTPILTGYYLKPSFDIEKAFKHLNGITISGSYASEINDQKYRSYDSLSLNSFSFTSYSAQIKNNTASTTRWSFGYTERTNQIPVGNALINNDISSNYTYTLQLLKNKKSQLKTNITYRELTQVYGPTKGNKETTVLSRTEYTFNQYKGAVKGNLIYEIGNGQEQKKDLSYVQVDPGKGQYIWIDYNKDGIQQLNEFVIAQFQDQANFVRVFTPSDVYIKSNYTIFGYNLQIVPSIAKPVNKGLMKIIRIMSIQSSLQSESKTLYDGKINFNPFKDNINDTSLIQSNYSWNNTLSINRLGNWGIDAGRNSSYNKSLLTYGLESTELTEYTFRGRISFKQKFQFELLQKFTDKKLITPSFTNQNYSLTGISSEPKLTFSPNPRWRLITSYQYSNISDLVIYGGEVSTSNSLNLESKFNLAQNTGINIKFSSSNISFTGTNNTTISYVMLNGLQPGNNYLWNIEFTKRLMNSLEISFNYEGRKAGENQTVNIGRATVRAIL